MIEVFFTGRDEVIRSTVATGTTNYGFALDSLFPLLDRFAEQRKTQSKRFYARLRKDILTGCIMPPITLAFISEEYSTETDTDKLASFLNENINSGYILDGMQRLNTLHDASSEKTFDRSRPLFLNVIIAERYDLLLYRMITLNNGQKPMTVRHQIEMLTKGAIDLSGFQIKIVTEKETEDTKIHGAFKKSDIVEAYTSFLTDSVNNQNSKIIETKLDEIIVAKVMESDLSEADVSFSDILRQVERHSQNAEAKTWLRQVNNLIGFTVGAKRSLALIQDTEPDHISECLARFETAFEVINPSKVNVGKFRRELAAFFFRNFERFVDTETSDIEAAFVEQTIAD